MYTYTLCFELNLEKNILKTVIITTVKISSGLLRVVNEKYTNATNHV